MVFSWIVYKSRKDRGRINARVMDSKALPFDGKRMFWDGFKTIVSL